MQWRYCSIAGMLFFLLICGCDTQTEQGEWAQPRIQLLMAPALAQQVPVSVEISVTDAEGTQIFNQPQRPNERSFLFDIQFVPGDVTVAVTITFDDGTVIRDVKQIRLTPEQNIINFSLDAPNQLSVGIDSDESFPIQQGEEFSVYAYIRNVTDLHGAAIRLRFDENFVSPIELTPGSFWGARDTDFIWIHDLENHEANQLNVAWTRLETPLNSPNQDKAELVRVRFKANRATASQPTTIAFIVAEGANNSRSVFRLQNKAGDDVDGFDELREIVAKREYPIDIR